LNINLQKLQLLIPWDLGDYNIQKSKFVFFGVFFSVNFFTPKLRKIRWSSLFFGSFAPHFQIKLSIQASDFNSKFISMSELELFLLIGVLTQNFNTMDLVKFLGKKSKTSHLDRSGHIEGDYVGIFDSVHASYPNLICEVLETFLIPLTNGREAIDLQLAERFYQVGKHSKLLLPVEGPISQVLGIVKQVQIVPIFKGQSRNKTVHLLYGRVVQDLIFDPARYQWKNHLGRLHSFSMKKGRTQILYPCRSLVKPILKK
jgi:hypothetical protein